MNDARSALYRVAPEVTVELVKLFTARSVCDDETLHDLLRTRRMHQHLAPCRDQLARLGIASNGRRCPVPERVMPPSPYVLGTYNRERLYEEAGQSLRKLSRSISDVMLAKVGRQLQIPKPPRGYWRRKQTGATVPKRPELAPLKQ
jgi:hypothetical protein